MGVGTIVRDADDYPNVLALNRHDAEDWLDAWNANPENMWNRENLFLFLKLSSFRAHNFLSYVLGFSLEDCRSQPPSILPMLLRGSESKIYFLSSIAFISQAI